MPSSSRSSSLGSVGSEIDDASANVPRSNIPKRSPLAPLVNLTNCCRDKKIVSAASSSTTGQSFSLANFNKNQNYGAHLDDGTR